MNGMGRGTRPAARAVGAGLVLGAIACTPRPDPHGHMVRSLTDFASAESTYYAQHGRYTAVEESLQVEGRPFAAAPDVRFIISWADGRGWHAVASNMETDEICRLTRWAPGSAQADTAPPQCR